MRWILLLLLQSSLFAGSAGLKNGSIGGNVYSDNGKPLAGANVVIVKEGDPPIIRSTVSNANGAYYFPSVPIGAYTLGYSKYGFKTISTAQGKPEDQTAIGAQVRVYVESGMSVSAPSVRLDSLGPFGQASVKIQVVDQFTGQEVRDATVILGNTATTSSSGNGEYLLHLNIPPGESPGAANQALQIQAPGFDDVADEIQAIAGQTTEYIVELPPKVATIEGRLDFSAFPLNNLASQTSVQVRGIPKEFAQATVSDDGNFSVKVPVSTRNTKKSYDLVFHTKGFQPMVVSNVMAPEAGAVTLSAPVVLAAIVTPVTGQVATRFGSSGVPSGVNQAFLEELGISTSVSGGNYTFSAVPTGVDLTLKVFLMNQFGQVETGTLTFRATTNGTGIFRLPTVITEGGENPNNPEP